MLKSFWEGRYANQTDCIFDFYLSPKRVIQVIQPYLPKRKNARILHIGCGQSGVVQEFDRLKYKRVLHGDWSAVAIQQWKDRISGTSEEGTKNEDGANETNESTEKNDEKKSMDLQKNSKGDGWKYTTMESFEVIDARNLGMFHDGEFELILDKAMLDVLLSGNLMECIESLREIYRTLKVGHVYVCFSNSGNRSDLLKRSEFRWKVLKKEVSVFKKDRIGNQCFFMYVCRKFK